METSESKKYIRCNIVYIGKPDSLTMFIKSPSGVIKGFQMKVGPLAKQNGMAQITNIGKCKYHLSYERCNALGIYDDVINSLIADVLISNYNNAIVNNYNHEVALLSYDYYVFRKDVELTVEEMKVYDAISYLSLNNTSRAISCYNDIEATVCHI